MNIQTIIDRLANLSIIQQTAIALTITGFFAFFIVLWHRMNQSAPQAIAIEEVPQTLSEPDKEFILAVAEQLLKQQGEPYKQLFVFASKNPNMQNSMMFSFIGADGKKHSVPHMLQSPRNVFEQALDWELAQRQWGSRTDDNGHHFYTPPRIRAKQPSTAAA